MICRALLSFAIGIWLLQQQATLPSLVFSLVMLSLVCVFTAAVAIYCHKQKSSHALGRQKNSYLLDRRGHLCGQSARGEEKASINLIYFSKLALVCLWMLFAGFSWAAWCAHQRLQDRLSIADEGITHEIVGCIVNLPSTLVAWGGQPGWRFVFELEHPQHFPKRFLLSWYGNIPDVLQTGQCWRLRVTLKRPHGLANPGGSDYEAWLLQQNIGATGSVRGGARLAEISFLSLQTRVAQWRMALIAHIKRALPADAMHAGVLQALVVGEQRAVSESDWTIFRRTGTSHLLAISGLHITLIASMAGFLAAWCWRRSRSLPIYLPAPTLGWLIGWLVALIYALLAGFQIPARRAFIMLSVVIVAHLSGRLTTSTVILCWALFSVLLFDPWAVLSAGFWLSFAAVAAILFCGKKGFSQDPIDDGDTQKKSLDVKQKNAQAVNTTQHIIASGQNKKHALFIHRYWGKLRQASKIQLAVSLVLIPFTALFFGQIALLAPLANAVAIPAFSFFITPLALLGALAPPWLASYLLSIAHHLIEWVATVLQYLSTWPWAVWSVSVPPNWVIGLSVCGTVCFLYNGHASCTRRPNNSIKQEGNVFTALSRWIGQCKSALYIRRLVGLLCLLPLFLYQPPPPALGEFRATILDVGQGGAILIQTAKHTLLYDSGPGYPGGGDAAARVVLPYLQAQGIKQLDKLLISHQDLDHSGGMKTILRHLSVSELSSSIALDHPLLRFAQRQSVPHIPCEVGQSWEWDGVRFQILHPVAHAQGKANALSCVLRVTTAHQALLLPGDIEQSQEADMLARSRLHGDDARAIQANVLVMPHHGSRTSSSAEWLDAVQPKVAIAQVGYRHRFGHPHADVVARYEERGIHLLRSDFHGAIEIQSRGSNLDWTAWRQLHRRYWHIFPDIHAIDRDDAY